MDSLMEVGRLILLSITLKYLNSAIVPMSMSLIEWVTGKELLNGLEYFWHQCAAEKCPQNGCTYMSENNLFSRQIKEKTVLN